MPENDKRQLRLRTIRRNLLAERYSGIQFSIVFLDASHIGAWLAFAIRTTIVMQINGKERISRRIRFFSKFFLEKIIVVTMHVQDNSTRIQFLRHRSRRTSKRILYQCRMKILVIRLYVNRINLIRFTKFRVHRFQGQRFINDRLQRSSRERLTVRFVTLLFLAGGKARICRCCKKKYG